MAIQSDEWDELVEVINTFPQAYKDVAAIAFRMGHEEGWWLSRTDPDSTVSPPEHEAKVNPFNGGTAKVTVKPYEEPARWGVLYHTEVTEYPDEAEARKQWNFACMDVPASLVRFENDRWVIVLDNEDFYPQA